MKIDIIAVGKLKEAYLKDAQKEYQKRLSRFCKLDIIEVDEEKPEGSLPVHDEKVKQKEGERIKKYLSSKPYTIVLDVNGKELNSIDFSNLLSNLFLEGKSDIAFIIGGSTGLDEQISKTADYRFSMSRLTFPHQLARIILLEQLYRSYKIINGETYHK